MPIEWKLPGMTASRELLWLVTSCLRSHLGVGVAAVGSRAKHVIVVVRQSGFAGDVAALKCRDVVCNLAEMVTDPCGARWHCHHVK
jgi:hypothetical protein